MALEIQVLTWNRHRNVVGLNWLIHWKNTRIRDLEGMTISVNILWHINSGFWMESKNKNHDIVCGITLWYQSLNMWWSTIRPITPVTNILVEETRVLGENHWPVANHWQILSHKSCIEYTSPWAGLKLTTLVVIGTDCIGSCKSNYHTITTTIAPHVTNKIGPLYWITVII